MSSVADHVKEKLSLLPDLPGVYQFFNNEGEIIYVGKAKSLKKRVSSYFMNKDVSPKTAVLVRQICDIKHIVVPSEAEALLLENNMIKSYQPRYNILLKDDKTFPWIAIKNEPFPRILSTRRIEKDGSLYFGPYASVSKQKMLLDLTHKLYFIRTCSLNLSPERIRQGKYSVCLEYHLGNCKGPCEGRVTPQEYAENVQQAQQLLRGNVSAVRKMLENRMNSLSEKMNFEEANRYKAKLQALENYQSKSVVVSPTIGNLDLFSLVTDGTVSYCNYMRIVDGAVVSSYTTELRHLEQESPEDILSYAISSMMGMSQEAMFKNVIVPFMPNGALFPGIAFIVPKRGDKLKLLELSEKNARLYRLEKLKNIEKKDPQKHVDRIMGAMMKDLYLSRMPYHIECFDNSNIQGTNPVAACVVFRDGRPSKKEYRHFNIKTVEGPNDFDSMYEVVFRRYRRVLDEGGELPQLVVVDGGKGQLSAALRALEALGLAGKVAIISLAERLEEVYFPHDSVPHYLDKSSETLKVLMNIRDEAHRFGITFHRNKRSAGAIRSELDGIPSIGEKSRLALLKKFRTIKRIKAASVSELAAVVGNKRAKEIAAYFQGGTASFVLGMLVSLLCGL